MTREEAEAVAVRVRAVCDHAVEVLADGEFWVVSVARSTDQGPDTFTLYNADDWEWLRERISS